MHPTDPLPCHSFQQLSQVPGLIQGIFDRRGGVSRAPYASLNVAWGNGDAPEHVAENLGRIQRRLGLRQLVAAPQVHGTGIHEITEETLAACTERFPIRLTAPGDALLTRLRGVGLLIKVADCQAVFLVDPLRRVLANVHCGWRGSVAGVIPATIRTMEERFGCRSRDLLAAIGPSLGPCCAEFRNYREELPQTFWGYETRPNHFDFWRITRDQLLAAGVAAHHIETAGRCTVCEPDYFSYRREKITGRQAAVLAWA